MTNFYGICRGGPYNLKRIVHHGPMYWAATHAWSGKPAPAQQDHTVNETFQFGVYRWNSTRSEWDWDETSVSDVPPDGGGVA